MKNISLKCLAVSALVMLSTSAFSEFRDTQSGTALLENGTSKITALSSKPTVGSSVDQAFCDKYVKKLNANPGTHTVVNGQLVSIDTPLVTIKKITPSENGFNETIEFTGFENGKSLPGTWFMHNNANGTMELVGKRCTVILKATPIKGAQRKQA